MTYGRSPPDEPLSSCRLLALLAGRLVMVTALSLACAPLAAGVAGASGDGGRSVLVTRVDDAITPVIADHLGDALRRAEDGRHAALVIELDTPGGLSTSMREIVQSLLGAEVPVVVYVTPSGARAASAGALITWSAHVAAMAPGTTIGAATPVNLESGEVADKVVEDAAAYARAVAEERGRNIELAAAAVTEGRAMAVTEAVDAGLADLEVPDLAALLDAIDGTTVQLGSGERVRMHTAGAELVTYDMTVLRSVLQLLADPNLAFLFFSVGSLGLIYELASPGIGAGGGVGALLIILGLVSSSVLPVDAAGLLFFLVAMALFATELFAPGIGIAAAMGSVALVLAGAFAFRDDTPGLSLSLAAVIPTAAVVGIAVVGAGRLALRVRERSPVSGTGGLVGREATVESTSGSVGQVRLEGSWWSVRSSEALDPGDRIRVTDVDGIELVVEPITDEEKELS